MGYAGLPRSLRSLAMTLWGRKAGLAALRWIATVTTFPLHKLQKAGFSALRWIAAVTLFLHNDVEVNGSIS